MRKFITVFWSLTAIILFILSLVLVQNAEAQSRWGVGTSFEIRDNAPSNGFGLRLERGIFSDLPLVDIKMRAHFSYFSESVESYRDIPGEGISSADLGVYDFGLAATGGISFGLLNPYVGAGLGSENFRAVMDDFEDQNVSDDNLYWNLYGGALVSILPRLKPFVEYRFTRLLGADEFDYNHDSRFAIGVMLEF